MSPTTPQNEAGMRIDPPVSVPVARGIRRAAKAAAILALVGVVNLPIIEISVQWWTTLHQSESIFRRGGPLISAVFLWPLFVMAAAYTLLFFTLLIVRMRTEILERRARTLAIA